MRFWGNAKRRKNGEKKEMMKDLSELERDQARLNAGVMSLAMAGLIIALAMWGIYFFG